METTTRPKVSRDKPSSKARSRSYKAMRKLFDLLGDLDVVFPYDDIDEDDTLNNVDYKGWKDWANKHTPLDKRGGPAYPSRKRKSETKIEHQGD